MGSGYVNSSQSKIYIGFRFIIRLRDASETKNQNSCRARCVPIFLRALSLTVPIRGQDRDRDVSHPPAMITSISIIYFDLFTGSTLEGTDDLKPVDPTAFPAADFPYLFALGEQRSTAHF